MKKILFTGFEPFGADTINPSWEAVLRLPDEIDGTAVVRYRLPVEYDTAAKLLEAIIEKELPDAVICVGQAGGRSVMTPEMVAINWKDASIPDNRNVRYEGTVIREDGPAAYFSTIPVKAIAAAMREAGVPASVSYTAGTYVCNNLMYHLLFLLEQRYPAVKGGFIHTPYTCEQISERSLTAPSLPLEMMTRGLIAAARALLYN